MAQNKHDHGLNALLKKPKSDLSGAQNNINGIALAWEIYLFSDLTDRGGLFKKSLGRYCCFDLPKVEGCDSKVPRVRIQGWPPRRRPLCLRRCFSGGLW